MSFYTKNTDDALAPNAWGAGCPYNRGLRSLFLVFAALLTAGCGDDRPDVSFQPEHQVSASPAPPSQAPAALAPAPTGNDSLVAPDQLAAGAGGSPTADPGDAPPLDSADRLAEGPKMPTAHSHWLHGGVFNAVVDVSLNGLPLGTFRSPVDKDITMSTREGANTITFSYTPTVDTSSAHLDVLESEHHPPIAPLASFRSPPFTTGRPQQPVKQCVTFVAQ